ncbi:MAG: nuclear transport factor 2 family protein [Reyranella sp.]|nr:nuclear transport factor 2 family protein [Reyranella sp.]
MDSVPNRAPVVDDAFMLRFFDAWKRKSADDIISMVTDDAVLESAFGPEPHGKRFVGKKAWVEGIDRFFLALKDASTSDRTYAIMGDKGFTEVTVNYVGPDGKRIVARVCDLFEFRDGKVASKRAYSKRIMAD